MSDIDATDRDDPESAPASDGDVRIYRYLAPAALAALALLQLFLGQVHLLTPWKGGGFGMFSSTDSPSARTLRLYLETADREIPTRLPSWIRNQEKYARSFPADFRLRSIADELVNASWHWVPGNGYDAEGRPVDPAAKKGSRTADKDKKTAYPPISSRKPGEAPREDRVQIALTGVRLEVWRRRYDAATGRLSIVKLKEMSMKVPPK